MSRLAVLVPSFVVALAAPAFAVHHISDISEVMSGVGADPTVQYVEINMESTFQNAVANTRLTAFNCNGTSHQVLMIVPANVTNDGAGVKWIMASQSFAAASGITPDFTWNTTTDGSIDPTCGMVCWGAPGIVPPSPGSWSETDPNQYVDCVAYGGYTGTTKTSDPDADGVSSSSGTPTTLAAGNGSQSLSRTGSTNNNVADFALAAPTPTNNAGMIGLGGTTTTTAPGATTTTTTTPGATTTTTTIAPSGKSKCSSKELAAAGKKASAKLKCESKAVAKGNGGKLSTCLAKTEASFGSAYASAIAAGGCRTAASAATVGGKVDGFVNDLLSMLVGGSGTASKCSSKELAAAGKKASAKIRCHSKAVGKGNGSKLPGCLAVAEAAFSKAYAKATAAGGCLEPVSATPVEGKVDAFVADLRATIAP